MQKDRQAQRSNQIRALWRPRALAALVAALLLAPPLMPSAHAQGAPAAQPSTGSSAAPPSAAASPAPAPAPSAASANPQAGAGDTPDNPRTATPQVSASGEPSVQGELLPQKLSFERMFLDADRIVKAVMIGLALASLVSWTVFIAKTLELRRAQAGARRGLRVLVEAVTFGHAHDKLREGKTPVAQLVQAAAQEIRLSVNARGDGLKERIALQLERLEMANARKIARGTGILATIGSTAVFVGLFGTVWGIMNSFIGISNAHTTNLAVVAPGIAQALLATAMGLIAAIPAVVIYNVLTRRTLHYRALLGDASAQIVRLVSRDLDRAGLPVAEAAE
jgi:biopolymer transport protein ExbB